MITLKELSKNTIHHFILQFKIQKRVNIYKLLCDNNKYNFKVGYCTDFIMKSMLVPHIKQTRKCVAYILKIIEEYNLYNYFNFNTQWDKIILEYTTYPSYINFSNSVHNNFYHITSNKSLNTLTKLQKFNDFFQRMLTIINDTLKETDNDLMIDYQKSYKSLMIKLIEQDRFLTSLEIDFLQTFINEWDEIYQKRNDFVLSYLNRFERAVYRFSNCHCIFNPQDQQKKRRLEKLNNVINL